MVYTYVNVVEVYVCMYNLMSGWMYVCMYICSVLRKYDS